MRLGMMAALLAGSLGLAGCAAEPYGDYATGPWEAAPGYYGGYGSAPYPSYSYPSPFFGSGGLFFGDLGHGYPDRDRDRHWREAEGRHRGPEHARDHGPPGPPHPPPAAPPPPPAAPHAQPPFFAHGGTPGAAHRGEGHWGEGHRHFPPEGNPPATN